MSNEWYTKPRYIEAAREVMGGIDLDPASCSVANQIVKAQRYYTQEENGLEQDWTANSIWLNPPYNRTASMLGRRLSLIKAFSDKLISEYEAGHVRQAILLATSEVNAKWFQPLWKYPICIPDHRVHFIVPQKRPHGDYKQMFGTVFVYLGQNEQKFIDVFGQFGHIVKRLNKPQSKPAAMQLWTSGSEVTAAS